MVTLPDAVTRTARDRLGLVALQPPLPLPDVPPYLLWHQRYDDDRAHTWLRETAAETVRALFAPDRLPTAPPPPGPAADGPVSPRLIKDLRDGTSERPCPACRG
ncbi:type 2 periplasmic-binding domain-containing protein [Streptomyces erythrochromogenes]|uniref:hypothetical protein n=1 Tax=Streptomyces erythrochromogenes TaxID=285574 RepID=UPI0037FF2000